MGSLMIILFSFLCVIICHYHRKHNKIKSIVSNKTHEKPALTYLLRAFAHVFIEWNPDTAQVDGHDGWDDRDTRHPYYQRE